MPWLPATVSTTLDSVQKLAIIVCARHSWEKSQKTILETYAGNAIVLQKFIRDFVHPHNVFRTESVVRHGVRAMESLPWGLPPLDVVRTFGDGPNFENRIADAKFCDFFKNLPAQTTAVVLIRGIDGSSIHSGSWQQLHRQRSHIHIVLAFCCNDQYVQACDLQQRFFRRLEQYDGKLYAFVRLSTLVNHLNDTAHDAMSAWLLEQWEVGCRLRHELGFAIATGDLARISAAQAAFQQLKTSFRHKLPIINDN